MPERRHLNVEVQASIGYGDGKKLCVDITDTASKQYLARLTFTQEQVGQLMTLAMFETVAETGNLSVIGKIRQRKFIEVPKVVDKLYGLKLDDIVKKLHDDHKEDPGCAEYFAAIDDGWKPVTWDTSQSDSVKRATANGNYLLEMRRYVDPKPEDINDAAEQ